MQQANLSPRAKLALEMAKAKHDAALEAAHTLYLASLKAEMWNPFRAALAKFRRAIDAANSQYRLDLKRALAGED